MDKQVTKTFDAPTAAQISFATSLASRRGYSYLSQAEKACFGKQKIGGLNRQLMSELIDWLKAKE